MFTSEFYNGPFTLKLYTSDVQQILPMGLRFYIHIHRMLDKRTAFGIKFLHLYWSPRVTRLLDTQTAFEAVSAECSINPLEHNTHR